MINYSSNAGAYESICEGGGDIFWAPPPFGNIDCAPPPLKTPFFEKNIDTFLTM